ncbi:DNA polymerase III subunit beta [Pseudogracilibacillus auburnensis]|uniref:Beta sliding clamp n=1 Tax=Pseudogracilibacillus auburnensis TaxID=1494959 RepID=A0A2V3VP48_9BACI|nr:DNA polymerase III subunit beta [Pseudogracilibacillus auburnensis]MBO1004174.1 DNA polymerase III subunit beta [Pseudogracilibacillus auburnensis]PXW83586.1 DNA polymerase III beta subunit [Pseudogracilibacillus auburnensis]
MKFKIQKKYLLNSIQAVSNAISSRTVIPILTGMKIDVTPSKIVLTGSNSDITIQSHIPSMKEEEEIITDMTAGSIVLPVPHFPEIIRKLPEDIVHVTVEDNYKTIIQSGKAVFTLYGQSSEEYPHIKINQSEDHLTLNIKDLKTLIRQTVFAVSPMETRPILTGVNVSLTNDLLTFTATDSHRLALRSINIKENNLEADSIVIPGKSLQDLNKIFDDHDGKVHMTILKNQVLFYTDHLYFLSRLLSGNYPETSRLIPNESKTTLHIFTKDLIHTIERAALLSSRDQNNVIRLDTLENNIIEISGNSPEIGNVKEQLGAVSIEGEELKISFSSRYMLDTLRTIDSERVQIDFTGAMRPFVIRTPDEDKILQLILPVRTF